MNDRIARQRQIVAEHIRGENDKDWEALYGTFVQDDRAHYQVVPLGTVFRGIDGARGFYQSIEAAFPDFHIDVRSEYHFPVAPSWKSSSRALTRATSSVSDRWETLCASPWRPSTPSMRHPKSSSQSASISIRATLLQQMQPKSTPA